MAFCSQFNFPVIDAKLKILIMPKYVVNFLELIQSFNIRWINQLYKIKTFFRTFAKKMTNVIIYSGDYL